MPTPRATRAFIAVAIVYALGAPWALTVIAVLVASALGATSIAAQQAPDTAFRVADSTRAHDAGGASRTVLDSAALAGAPMRTFSEMLAARVPGLSVLRSSGTTGTGSRVRLRGAGGVLASDEPLLVIDGVRAEGEQVSLGIDVGGQQPSRLDDVVPEDVERVEILKGPAAAWRYGSRGANGVIVVTTKRGRPGPARWQLLAARGVATDRTDFPANYGTPGMWTGSGQPADCPLDDAAGGWCVPDGPMRSWNPLERVSPFRTGRQQQAAASVAGGSRTAGYYVGAGVRDELGVLKTSDARRVSARANVDLRPRDDLRLALSGGYVDGRTRLPPGDRAGVLFGGLLGESADDPVYRGYAPQSVLDSVPVRQDVGRLTASLAAAWRPRSWLDAGATVGVENVNRVDARRYPSGWPDPSAATTTQAADGHKGRLTINLEATGHYGLARRITGSTSVGVERARERIAEHRSERVTSGAGDEAFSRTWVSREGTSTGLFVRQRVSWADRVHAGVGLRTDANHVGTLDFVRAFYPAADAVWTAYAARPSARLRWLDALRLRAAYAEAGDLRAHLYAPVAFALIVLPPGGTAPAPARPTAQTVQRSRERELGVEARLFGGRAGFEITHFRKTTGDVQMVLPVAGTGITFPLVEDAWRNEGFEVALTARVLDRAGLRWDAVATLGTNRSELLTANGGPGMPLGDPLGGYWTLPYHVADANGDRVIEQDEVLPDTGSDGSPRLSYVGPSVPTREASLASRVRVANRVTLGALLDHRGGHRRLNRTEQVRCGVALCEARHDPAASLADQARAIVATGSLAGSIATFGFLEDGSFTRLRELSAEVELPAAWARQLGARGVSFTLAARNLAAWTSYGGLDPEVSATGQAGTTVYELFTQPLLRSVGAKVDVAW